MIDLYTWTTPNGRKVSIMLEELRLPYTVHAVNIGADEQFDPAFVAINPNSKIPAIVDREAGVTLTQSGAILLYLADKAGRFLPAEPAARWEVLDWLMWQMGDLGPMLGQAHHFLKFNEGKAPYAETRYHNTAKRLYGVLDRRLAGRDYIAGDYSVADIAVWPWTSRFEWHRIDMDAYPNVKRWYLSIAARPAVEAGYHVPKKVSEVPRP
jgi:GST-like protein